MTAFFVLGNIQKKVHHCLFIMKKGLLILLCLISLGLHGQENKRINKSLYTGTIVNMRALNDTVRYYEFGKPDNIIISGDYDYIYDLLSQMKYFSRDSKWGDKLHITENLSIERHRLTGPHAYRIVNDSVGTKIYTGFNSISESWHSVWVNRPTNADARAKARRDSLRQLEDTKMPMFDGPFGGFGGFGGPF